jgi:hypothetical protein
VNELGAAAVAYAERGWHVFPVAPRGKVPVTKRRMLDASLDEGLVAAWWEQRLQANIGVACGPSGLVVVDLDGEEAVRGWADLVARHGGHERTLVARTGKGFHLYFAGEGRSSAGRIGPRIDTRGAGGYVIAPPSVHGSGAVYQWIDATLDPVPVLGTPPTTISPRRLGSKEKGRRQRPFSVHSPKRLGRCALRDGRGG